jgi:hypothetical protein
LSNDTDLFNKAYLAVLQQSTLVTLYIEEHKQIISSQILTKTEPWVTRHHLGNFPSRLSEQVLGDSTIHPQLALLARGPSSITVKFQAYDIMVILFTQVTKFGKPHTKIVVSV